MQGANATARAPARAMAKPSSWPGPSWDWAVSAGRSFLAIEPFLKGSCADCLCSHRRWRGQTTAAVARQAACTALPRICQRRPMQKVPGVGAAGLTCCCLHLLSWKHARASPVLCPPQPVMARRQWGPTCASITLHLSHRLLGARDSISARAKRPQRRQRRQRPVSRRRPHRQHSRPMARCSPAQRPARDRNSWLFVPLLHAAAGNRPWQLGALYRDDAAGRFDALAGALRAAPPAEPSCLARLLHCVAECGASGHCRDRRCACHIPHPSCNGPSPRAGPKRVRVCGCPVRFICAGMWGVFDVTGKMLRKSQFSREAPEEPLFSKSHFSRKATFLEK